MKKQKASTHNQLDDSSNLFDLLSEEIVFTILGALEGDPHDKKAFSLVCRSFYAMEAKHRRTLKPLRSESFPALLRRYPHVTHLDLSLCPRVTDSSLTVLSRACESSLRSIDLSRSKFFSGTGLLSLATNCRNLVEIDLSNATDLRDAGAAAVAEAKQLERLWLGRCKLVTDMGIGCIAVGCKKLRLLSLKWCLGIGDLGVGLLAVKCKEIRNLDLSHVPITNQCLPLILKLQYLEDLVLEGCFGIDDDNLAVTKHECKTLKTLDLSSCPNISHVGLSSLTSGAGCLQQLTLAHGSPATLAFVDSLQMLSILQSIKLDGCQVTCSGLKAIGSRCASLRELSLSKCSGVTDDEAFVLIGQRCHFLEELDLTDNEVDNEGLKSISQCLKLSSLKLGLCLNVTDQGLAHVAMYCSKLKELDLYRCAGINDSGISSIACGCPDLEMINIAYCKDITDSSLSSLSKCLKLATLESRGCPLITSLGLGAIAAGCKQLTRLDIKKCYNIDDAGMIPLAQFSQNLRQINLSYSSVTDMGLLCLASIRCLQSITMLHLKGLTPSGLAAALLSCRGLTKVKLHASFKAVLPQPLLEHLEARGCVHHWRDKVAQAELDPRYWKLQLDDVLR